VDAKIIFSIALKCCACGIILAHNHPSGELFAGREDIGLTTKLKAAGKFLDIQVLDHLIISADGFYSFADEGMM
jgi:DNA repair protein RadC